MTRTQKRTSPRKKNNINEEINTKNATELFIQILPILRDFIPILLEKISEIQGRPTLNQIQKDNESLKEKLFILEKKIMWIFFFLIIQSFFMIAIFFYFIIKNH